MTSYVPGTSLAVVTPGRLVVLADRADADVDLLATASTTEILDVLVREGIGAMPAFALVERLNDARVRVVVRGAWEAVLGDRTVSGVGAATWIEQILAPAEVATVRVPGAAGPHTPRWPLGSGVVLAASVELTLGAAPASDVGAPGTAVALPIDHPDAEPVVEPEPVVPPEQITLVESPAAEESAAEESADAAATATPVAAPPAPVPTPDDGFDDLFGATVGRSAEEAAVRESPPEPTALIAVPSFGTPDAPPGPVPPTAPPAPAVLDLRLGDHDDHTVAGQGVAALLRGPAVVVEPVAAPVPVPALALSNGEHVEVAGAVVVGRRPAARNAVGAPPRLVTVTSPEGVVSGTHLEFLAEDGHLLVKDVSTNGTLVSRPGVEPQRLPARQLVVLTVGSRLELGDGVSIEVVPAGGAS